MAPYESDDTTAVAGADELRAARRRKAARYVVPAAVLGVAAGTIGLVPAMADSGSPDLPKISAQELIEKIAASDAQQLSGTVRISTDLGLPDLGGLETDLMSGAAASGGEGSAADPSAKLTELASGTHTLRVAADGPDRQKVSLLEDAAEYSLIRNGKDVWGYDSASNEVYHGTAAEGAGQREETTAPATPRELTEEALKAVDDTTSVTVDGTAQVAGRDAYKLLVEPKQPGSTVGAISVAVDAATGLPLKFTLTPASGGAAVVDAGFTQVSFAKPAASTFDFTPPQGAKVTEEGSAEAPEHSLRPEEKDVAEGLEGLNVIGEGWTSVAVLDSGAEGTPSGAERGGMGDAGALGGFLGSLGDEVNGTFGSGTVFTTRLVNALITDDGTVYVGAVTKDALVKAADSGQ
ncbi:LolA family protein [Streptomyces cinereospinus]|uniref:Outer membrane lipoprotein carrier protein LolA n=1 Tax=Streptomyces cinereospinus TaxID=285561 RepID=A0ABV5MY28_9ACTN